MGKLYWLYCRYCGCIDLVEHAEYRDRRHRRCAFERKHAHMIAWSVGHG